MKLKKNICEDCCKGKRISELDEKVDIQGTEYIPFLEGDDNGKFSLGSLKDYLIKLIEEYLINNGIIREDWIQSEPAYKLLATLPELIADRACKDEFGNNINDTYLTREAVKEYIGSIFEDLFTENPPKILDGYITIDMLSDAVLQLLNSGGCVTNFPDDEDLTVKDGKLKFKDKVYDPNNYSGMGRTILRKNMVDGVNVLTQEMMSEPNVIYVIQYDYDLRGETIVIPDNSILWYLGGSLNNGHITSNDEDKLIIWGNLNGDIEIDIDVSVVGAPSDEEDITAESGVLKFKDKEYDAASFSGLGRKYLRKNIVNGKNILTQDMVNSSNTIYIIQYNYDLNGQEIIVPENCVLQFEGGSFSNGTILGDDTDIKEVNKSLIFKNIIISGSWKVLNIYSDWFEFNQVSTSNSLLNLLNLCNLSTDNFTGIITIDKGNYYIDILNRSTDFISPYNNTTIILNGTIIVNANSHDTYHVFRIALKNNITIKGKGTLIGDVETHTAETGESGMGISLYSANNVTIKGLTITKFWGDGIYIGQVIQTNTDYGTNILMEDLDLTYNRRQGISITAGENITVRNCRITDTGGIKVTEPGAGIDIEPNYSNQVVRNINIEGCYFARNNKTNNGDLLVTGMFRDGIANENFSCTVSNCYFSGTVRLTSSIRRMTITSSYIGNFIPEYTGSHYYKVMVSGCLIDNSTISRSTNPGLYISGCSYLNEDGTTLDRVFSGNTTGSTPYIKIKFTKFDGIIKMTLFSKYITTDNYTCSEVILKSRWIDINDEKFFKKVHTNIYDHSLLGSINLDTLYEHCLLVSLPILDTDNPNFWYVYVKDSRITRYDYTIKLENVLNSVYDMPFFTGVTVETITESELPEELDFKDSFSLFIYGSTSAITEHLIASIGTTVYDTTLNKMKVWNGSTWVNMDGTALE